MDTLRKAAFHLLMISSGLMLFTPPAYAQTSNCENGILRLPAGVNGTLTICPAIAKSNPQLSAQLTALGAALSKQQIELDELLKLAKNVNGVGRQLDQKQQAEMLKTLLAFLTMTQRSLPGQLTTQLMSFSDQFQSFQGKLVAANATPEMAAKANTLMLGPAGDAVARLDFQSAIKQLESIQADVKDIKKQTAQIANDTEQIKNDTRDLKVLFEENQVDSRKSLANPDIFAHVSITPMLGKLLIVMSHSISPQKQPTLRMQFRKAGTEPWTTTIEENPVVSSIEQHTVTLEESIDNTIQAIVCYSAIDPRTSQRRYWSQSYKAEDGMAGRGSVLFNPASETTLTAQSTPECMINRPYAAPKEALPDLTESFVRSPENFARFVLHYYRHLTNKSDHRPGTLQLQIFRSGFDVTGSDLAEQRGRTLRVLFRKSQDESITVPIPLNPNSKLPFEERSISLDSIGDEAIVCYSAIAAQTSGRLYWSMKYTASDEGPNEIRFDPSTAPLVAEKPSQECSIGEVSATAARKKPLESLIEGSTIPEPYYHSSEDGFSAHFPVAPAITASDRGRSYESRIDGVLLGVYVVTLPSQVPSTIFDTDGERIGRETVENMHGLFLSMRHVSLGRQHGIETVFEKGAFHIVARTYVVGRHQYQIMVNTPIGKTYAEELAFFDSFLLDSPASSK